MFGGLNLNFGSPFKAMGQDWVTVKTLTHGWVLAIMEGDNQPAMVYLLQDPKLVAVWEKLEEKEKE